MPLNLEANPVPEPDPGADIALREGVDFRTFTVRLPLRHADWLERRAALFGQEPAAHAVAILLEFKGQHDTTGATNHRQAPPERGEMALTYRPR